MNFITGLKCSMWPTCTTSFLAFATSTIFSASAIDVQIGFSMTWFAIFFEELHGDLRVPVGRNHDADGVARLAELRRRAEYAAAEPVGDFLRPRGVGVANSHELGAFELRIYAGVVLPEIADAHYAALQLFAIVHTPATLPRPSAITSKYSPPCGARAGAKSPESQRPRRKEKRRHD